MNTSERNTDGEYFIKFEDQWVAIKIQIGDHEHTVIVDDTQLKYKGA